MKVTRDFPSTSPSAWNHKTEKAIIGVTTEITFWSNFGRLDRVRILCQIQ
jgi:hypothetical protein